MNDGPAPERDARFRVMGSDAHLVIVGGADDALDVARARVEQLEARWSRFRPDSEVSELNRRAGEAVAVSSDTEELVRLAVAAWRLTGGAFDATVLGAVIRAGYDASFDDIAADPHRHAGVSALIVGCTDIEVPGDGTVRLPPGTGFDPGGIGKGLAADIVSAEVMAAGAAGVCVNLGGDLRLRGEAPGGEGWTVAIEHPWSDEPLGLVGVGEGAVATSTTLRRTWDVDGVTRHHLIDPATGEPSTSDLTLAAVIAGDAWAAEVLAKAVLLRGSAHPFDLLGGIGAVGVVVDDDGNVTPSDGFAAYLGGGPLLDRVTPPST